MEYRVDNMGSHNRITSMGHWRVWTASRAATIVVISQEIIPPSEMVPQSQDSGLVGKP